MKKSFIALSVLSLSLFACVQHPVAEKPANNKDYDKAEALVFKDNDSAFYYFNKVVTTSTDSIDISYSYNYMAMIQSEAGDYFGAQESAMLSLNFLNENDTAHFDCLTSNYNELGMTSFNLKRYDSALSYYDLAMKFTRDKLFNSIVLNNKAIALQKNGAYSAAIDIYNKIIPTYKDQPREFARTLSNLSRTRWLKQSNYNAGPSLLKALSIREKENDEWGLNASYSHLSDYYKESNADAALIYAQRMYEISSKLKSPDDQLEALQKLIQLSPPAEIKKYFRLYYHLADSLQTARNAAKNQFAVVRYESEKAKAANLVLQQENSRVRIQILTREFLLGFALVIFAATGLIVFLMDKRRRQKMEMESRNLVRDNQLRTSKRVHDVVANGLYRVMTQIENQEGLNKERLLDSIEDLYEKSRDISYEKAPETEQDFQDKVSTLLKSFATTDTKVIIAGNTAALWQKINPVVKYELEHILQELMVNMKKHSQAKSVVVRFEAAGDKVNVYYTDDGIGIPEGMAFKNGLRNTGNRMEFINGDIIFGKHMDKGLKITLSVPTN